MESMGLDTIPLQSLYRSLYEDGIGQNSSAWDTAEQTNPHLTVRFDHTFLWRNGSESIVGQLWYSKDHTRPR